MNPKNFSTNKLINFIFNLVEISEINFELILVKLCQLFGFIFFNYKNIVLCFLLCFEQKLWNFLKYCLFSRSYFFQKEWDWNKMTNPKLLPKVAHIFTLETSILESTFRFWNLPQIYCSPTLKFYILWKIKLIVKIFLSYTVYM